MPQFLKHVGQIDSTGKKCVVVFREIPDDSTSCLVVETESLPLNYHDDLIVAVESEGSQADLDFYKFAGRTNFHDGRNMLEGLHLSGWLKKLATSEVTMLPTPELKIKLNDLNQQLGSMTEARTTSGDINGDTPSQATPPGVLDDAKIAAQMRSQADYFMNEARRLLKEAAELEGKPAPQLEQAAVPATSEPKPKRKYVRKK
jgi:hypothetical protein